MADTRRGFTAHVRTYVDPTACGGSIDGTNPSPATESISIGLYLRGFAGALLGGGSPSSIFTSGGGSLLWPVTM